MPTQLLPERTRETQVSLTAENWGPGCYPFGKTQRFKESGERVSETARGVEALVASTEFDPWEPQGGRREQNFQSSPLGMVEDIRTGENAPLQG